FEDEQDRQAKWAAFKGDPEWIEKKEASHKNGVIVRKVDSYVMTRVPYVTPAWR
ncbi:MAG: NIPSNAP family protein, partial [Christensenellales bacterium]